MAAIMARMAAYTGKEVTWEQAMNSKEDLTPPRYEWGAIATPPADPKMAALGGSSDMPPFAVAVLLTVMVSDVVCVSVTEVV